MRVNDDRISIFLGELSFESLLIPRIIAIKISNNHYNSYVLFIRSTSCSFVVSHSLKQDGF